MKPTLYTLLAGCFFLCLLQAPAQAGESGHLATRYGSVDVVADQDATVLRFQGKTILTLDADSASLQLISSNTDHEFVIVSAWQPGLNCHFSYRLMDIAPNGRALVSGAFGECKELAGAGFIDTQPVVHLSNPPTLPKWGGSYAWRDGQIREVFSSNSQCAALAYAAGTSGAKLDASEKDRHVTGNGRLPLLSAPADQCARKNVFFVPGDSVNATLAFSGFVFVAYTHPKTGKRVDGWVDGNRLAPSTY
ncbi:MAG: hypothetical protein ACJ8GW_06230 [Massilia sp.]